MSCHIKRILLLLLLLRHGTTYLLIIGGGYNYDSTSIRHAFDEHSTAYQSSLGSCTVT